MQIVIPMAGRGDRFLRAGYGDIKPLLPVDGRPMIERVVGMYPGESDFLFICSRDHLETTRLRSVLERAAPAGRIAAIEPHKLGPVHTLLQAVEHVRRDQPVLLSYCDFSVVWDWGRFKERMEETGCAGAVTVYRGFHPHSLGSTRYAYLRVEGDRLLSIQEKKPYTSDPMNEYASAGSYYFSSGALLEATFRRAVERGLATKGEFFASTPYNLLVEEGLDVRIHELEQFLQWGTPEDLQEYQAWSNYFRKGAGFVPTAAAGPGTNLVPMAGQGVRFRTAGYVDPKPLVPVAGVPMVRRALRPLPPAHHWLAVCSAEHLEDDRLVAALRADGRLPEVIAARRPTAGQVSSCLLARDRIDPRLPLLIAPCDSAVVYDEARLAHLTADPSVDCVVFCFRSHPHANRFPAQYGWVEADSDGRARRISCKVPLSSHVSDDPGIVGLFWFREGRTFLEAADRQLQLDRRTNGEFYVDDTIGVAIDSGLNVRVFVVDHYVCFGTPDDVRTFEYWERYFRLHYPGRPQMGAE